MNISYMNLSVIFLLATGCSSTSCEDFNENRFARQKIIGYFTEFSFSKGREHLGVWCKDLAGNTRFDRACSWSFYVGQDNSRVYRFEIDYNKTQCLDSEVVYYRDTVKASQLESIRQDNVVTQWL